MDSIPSFLLNIHVQSVIIGVLLSIPSIILFTKDTLTGNIMIQYSIFENTIFHITIFILPFFWILYAFDTNFYFGCVFFLSCLLLLISIFTILEYVVFPLFWNAKVMKIILATPMILMLCLIAVYIITGFFGNSSEVKENEFDFVEIEESVSRISDEMEAFEKTLVFEKDKIDNSLQLLLDKIKEQNENIISLQSQKQSLENEVKYYTDLKNMDEVEIQAVKRMFQEDRGKERLFSFFMGVITSLIAALLFLFMKKNMLTLFKPRSESIKEEK